MPKKTIILTNKDFIQTWVNTFVYPKEIKTWSNIKVKIKSSRKPNEYLQIFFPHDILTCGDFIFDTNDLEYVYFTAPDHVEIWGDLTAEHVFFFGHNTPEVAWDIHANNITISDSLKVKWNIHSLWIEWGSLWSEGDIFHNEQGDWLEISLRILNVDWVILNSQDIDVAWWMHVGTIKDFFSIKCHELTAESIDSGEYSDATIKCHSIKCDKIDEKTEVFILNSKPR